jgi:nicotinamidase-related amidase
MRNAAMATTQTTCCIRSPPTDHVRRGGNPVAATATASRSSERIDMTSEPIRDRLADPLLTPQNAALVVIDYQPSQIQAVRSMDHELLLDNIVSVARIGKTFGLPIVLSTVNVANGQGHTLPELKAVLSDNEEIDRTQINSWEDAEFRRAVEATGRKKLIIAALWTEVCLAFPTLDALREGYEVYPVVDAVGGTSLEAHSAGLQRIIQAGAQPISWVSLACELQRDWARVETVADVVDIVLTTRLLKSA